MDTSRLHLEWAEAPWDTAVFAFPVLQLTRLKILAPEADRDFKEFEAARNRIGAGLVSCRLAHDCMRESMLLEDRGFRFIEMLYRPELDDLSRFAGSEETGLTVKRAGAEDLPAVLEIAGTAFRNERFHVDPRLATTLGDQRYINWVKSSLGHPSQRLYVLRDNDRLVSFFITEILPDGTCYWHLNAVSPAMQGRGYGRRAWLTMLREANEQGVRRVRTCIVARNDRVLNLYAWLGFRFPPPLMTFHWVPAR